MTQEADVALVMDWGGTWSRMAVVNRAGAMLWRDRVRNAPGAGRERLLADAEGLIRRAVDWCGAEGSIAGLGVAVAGPVNARTGALRQPPNLPALDGVCLKTRWEPLGYPVYVGNDADLAALGEYRYGAGQEARQRRRQADALVYVTVSTGIGAGVIEQGRMLFGAQGMAAEAGHMTIDLSPDAPRCNCGNSGCLEAMASGTAIARAARRQAAQPEMKQSLLARGNVGQITAEQVFAAAGQDDALAWRIVNEAAEYLAVGLTNLLHLFNPDLMVLGGGVTSGLEKLGLLPRLQNRMMERAMSSGHREFRLTASGLGDAPGMLGAAALVWRSAPEPA